jgi:hypothetical protein
MIPINDTAEFKRVIRALADDIVHAHIHWQMQRDLEGAMEAYPLVRQQSNTFWHLTQKAHVGAAIHQLCRAFDQEPKSLHLLSWLLTIKDNPQLFSAPPDATQLALDIESCRDSDPLVAKLICFRGSSLAHRSATLSRKGKTVPQKMVLSVPEFEELLARAQTILNRYSRLFAAEAHSTRIIGASDYEFIFKTIQAAVEASEARIDDLMKQAQGRDANDSSMP